MFRRIRGWLVAGVATALVLTGCSAGGSAPAPAETAFNKDTAAEITFSWWGNEDRAQRFEQVIGMFNEEYPNVKVVRNFNSWGDYWTARNTEAAGRALPDAVMMDASYLGEYANKGLLKDLGPFRQNTLTLEGVSDSVLGSGTIGDKLVAVPLGTNAYSMMYNKKVLDAYGIEYPTSDMDWNQLNAFLMKVNQAGAGADPRIYGAEDYTGGFPGFIYHLMQSGNEVFTADGKPTFTEADVVSYLDSTASMRDAGDFYPIARSIALSPKGGFLAGETAVWFNFSTTVQQAMSDIGTEEIGMVAPPRANGSSERILASHPSMLLAIAENSKQPQAAAAFVNFLATSPKVAEVFGTSLGTPPTQEGRDAINQTAADKVNLGYLDAVKSDMTAGYPILPAGYGTIEAKWTELHERLRYGELTTQQFGQELFSEISLVLGR